MNFYDMSRSYAYEADIHNTVSSHNRDEIQKKSLFSPLLRTKDLILFDPHSFAAEKLADVLSLAVRESKSERDEEPRASLAVAEALVT